ncbi:MAG: hydrogenase maturation nickel metallochaperone HypA [Oscillospiraceae bacterium]
MHELSVVIQVVETVEKFAVENELESIESLVLQIGELSTMIPMYVEECFPMAAEGTILQDAKLEIEVIPGIVCCDDCGKEFNLLENNGKCPNCIDSHWELVSGREFFIKEIVAC